ncbi:MAG: hypothetical protein U1F11_15140 [Steroidobacteraceae bacterium]
MSCANPPLFRGFIGRASRRNGTPRNGGLYGEIPTRDTPGMRTHPALGCLLATLLGPAVAHAATPPDVAALIDALGLQADAVPVRERAGWRPLRRIVVRGDFGADAAEFSAPRRRRNHRRGGEHARRRPEGRPGNRRFPRLLRGGLARRRPGGALVNAFSAGVDKCVVLPAVHEQAIVVTNMQRALGPPMANAIALLLALARHLHLPCAPGNRPLGRSDGRRCRGTGPARQRRCSWWASAASARRSRAAPTLARHAGDGHARLGPAGPPASSSTWASPPELPSLAARADAVVAALPLTDGTAACSMRGSSPR